MNPYAFPQRMEAADEVLRNQRRRFSSKLLGERSQMNPGRRLPGMLKLTFASLLVCDASFGQSAEPTFEVASVRPVKSSLKESPKLAIAPGSINFTNVSLKDCVKAAYSVKPYQISGPGWLESERYDLSAKAAGAAPEAQLMQMLQSLLAERFQLKLHHETKELAVYALVAGKGGAKLQEGDSMAKPAVDFTSIPGAISFRNYGMPAFAEALSGRLFRLDRPVVDQTGLRGVYNINLKLADSIADIKRAAADSSDTPPVFRVLEQETGMRLTPQRASLDTIVIDHAEMVPTGN